jgi:hypothetical protein
MSKWTLNWSLPCPIEYKKQLMALGIIPGDPDLAAKGFIDLKTELDKEKAARIVGQIEIDVLTQAINDLKIYANRFAGQIPTLKHKVKHLENKVVDGLNEVRAQELCLEYTTRANDDYKKQNTQLTNELESKSFGRIRTFNHSWTILWLTLLPLAESNAELNTLKVMVDNAIAFFYWWVLLQSACPQILDNLSTGSREIILTNMRQSMSLTLMILKSLYPRADMDMVGEGFVVTYSDEEALKLVEDFAMMVGLVFDMLGVDMSLG